MRLRRRVEVVTSAGEVLGTGGDPRHDVIDLLATVGPDDRDRLPAVLENLRAHRRVDLVVAVLGRVAPDTLHALGMLGGIGVVVVLTQPAAVAPNASVLVVDASTTPFATAWNQALTRTTGSAWHRAVALVVAPFTLAALSVVAALSLARVVDSGRFVLPVVGAALLPHALGALVRWRGWPVWTGVVLSLFGLAVFIVLALEPSTTTLGIPTGDTWRALDHQLTGGWELLRNAPAPAPTTDGAILLAVLAVWTMAAIADWLAFGRQATLGAVSPALVFFVWTSTLGTSDWRLVLTVAFCVASAARSSSRRTSRCSTAGATGSCRSTPLVPTGWRPRRCSAPPPWCSPWSSRPRSPGPAPIRCSTSPTPAATTRRGAATGRRWRRSSTSARSSTTSRTRSSSPSPHPSPTTGASPPSTGTRVTDGGQWTLSAEGDGSVQVGLPGDDPGGTLAQQFSIGPLGERWLPAAFRPVAIDLDDTLVVKSSDTLVADASDVTDLDYVVFSKLPPSAGTQFTAAQIAATAGAVPPRACAPYTTLPESAEITEIARWARQVVGDRGATTPYAQAKALRDYFREHRLRLRHRRRQPRQRFGHPRVPARQARVLRAVRQRLRGDGAHARHPRPRGGRASHRARPTPTAATT